MPHELSSAVIVIRPLFPIRRQFFTATKGSRKIAHAYRHLRGAFNRFPFPAVSLSTIPWDFILILIVLGVLVPWRGGVRGQAPSRPGRANYFSAALSLCLDDCFSVASWWGLSSGGPFRDNLSPI